MNESSIRESRPSEGHQAKIQENFPRAVSYKVYPLHYTSKILVYPVSKSVDRAHIRLSRLFVTGGVLIGPAS